MAAAVALTLPARAIEPGEPPTSEPVTSATTDALTPAPGPITPPVETPQRKQPRQVNVLPLVSKDAPPPIVWKWRNSTAADLVVTAVGAGITLTASIVSPRAQHSLRGGLWFDQDVRDALRADALADRYVFRDASDVGLSLAVSWPFVADALTSAWWYRGSRETAQEMALIDLQTLAVSGAIQGATNVMVSRERPFGADCGKGELPGDALDCTGTFHYRSFFSGHSAFSFTAAALVCIHHFENELLGGPWDALSCAGGYAVAATTATFRVVADVHYASDVLTGAMLGTLVGYTVPLLHYRQLGGESSERASRYEPGSLELRLAPAPGGVGLVGIF